MVNGQCKSLVSAKHFLLGMSSMNNRGQAVQHSTSFRLCTPMKKSEIDLPAIAGLLTILHALVNW